MAPLYDFECEAHGIFESRAGFQEREKPCPSCGAVAKRVFSPQRTATVIPRRFFDGIPRSEVDEWTD